MRGNAGRRRTAPLVGRAPERALLQHLLAQADGGRFAAVVISGVAGAGKTALHRWLAGEARQRGAVVLTGAPSEDLLPHEAVERLFRPLGPVPGSSGAELAEHLVGAARRRLVLLALDDVHELDRATARGLADLLATVDDEAADAELRLLVSLTTREPIGSDGPAERALRLDPARSLRLGGLDEHELFELFEAFGQRPAPGLVARLLEETAGIPLLVGAALDEQARDPATRSGGGAGHDARVRAVAAALKPSLRAVDAGALDLLRTAAVLGEPWDPGELALVTGRSPEDLDEALGAAAEAGLVLLDGGLGHFAHPLVRTELLRPVPPAARRALHLRVAERLGTGEPRGELAVRLAGHLVRARPDVPAEVVADRAWEAGRVALSCDAWHHASQLLVAAAEALAATGRAGPAERAARWLAVAKAAHLDEDPGLCEQAAADALRTASEDPGAGALRLEAALVALRSRSGRPAPPGQRPDLTQMEEALAGAGPEVPDGLVVAAHAALAEALLLSGERDRAFALIDEARRRAGHLDRPGPGGDPLDDDPRFRLELVEGLHRLDGLELAAAADCFRRAGLRAGAGAGDGGRPALTARSRHALARLVSGSVAAATSEVRDVERRAVARRLWGEASLAAAQHAMAAVLAGAPNAGGPVERALRLNRRAGGEPAGALLAPAVAALAARRGGEDALAAAGRLAPAFSRSSVCAALRAVEAGDAGALRATLASAPWREGLAGPVTLQNQAVPVALVLAGDLLDDPELVGRAAGPLGVLHDRGVVVALGWPALVPRLLAVCHRMAGRLRDAGRLLDYAVAVCDRQELGAELALARFEQARLAAAGGLPAAELRPLVSDALRRLDALGLHGWVARAEALAGDLRLGPVAGLEGPPRERTILTTDIVGSTQANVRLGDVLYVEQLRVHDRLVRARVRQRNGVEIKHTGDGINAVFDDPADAVHAALDLQGDLARWRDDEPDLALRVRCGLARGRAIPSGGDLYGLVQSEAARLCALAEAGEVLASARVVEALEDTSGPPLEARSLGPHRLRGLPEVTTVYRLAAAPVTDRRCPRS